MLSTLSTWQVPSTERSTGTAPAQGTGHLEQHRDGHKSRHRVQQTREPECGRRPRFHAHSSHIGAPQCLAGGSFGRFMKSVAVWPAVYGRKFTGRRAGRPAGASVVAPVRWAGALVSVVASAWASAVASGRGGRAVTQNAGSQPRTEAGKRQGRRWTSPARPCCLYQRTRPPTGAPRAAGMCMDEAEVETVERSNGEWSA